MTILTTVVTILKKSLLFLKMYAILSSNHHFHVFLFLKNLERHWEKKMVPIKNIRRKLK